MEKSEAFATTVERARSGDAAAWEALYRRAYPRLHAYARRRLPTDDAARDAVAETMVRAVRSFASYRGEGAGFDAWLASIARHVVLDAQRRRGRKPETALPERFDAADGGPLPEDHVEQGEESEAMKRAFARLGDFDREVLELRVILGLSAEDAATVLKKRPGAVRMAQARALARLRTLLEQDVAGTVRHA